MYIHMYSAIDIFFWCTFIHYFSKISGRSRNSWKFFNFFNRHWTSPRTDKSLDWVYWYGYIVWDKILIPPPILTHIINTPSPPFIQCLNLLSTICPSIKMRKRENKFTLKLLNVQCCLNLYKRHVLQSEWGGGVELIYENMIIFLPSLEGRVG